MSNTSSENNNAFRARLGTETLITRQLAQQIVQLANNPEPEFITVIEQVSSLYERLDRLVSSINALSDGERVLMLTVEAGVTDGEWHQAQRLRLATAAFVEMVGMFHLYDNKLGQTVDAIELQSDLMPKGSLGKLVISVANQYCASCGLDE